jgi:tetratricopeptide (TPR) repeat protein
VAALLEIHAGMGDTLTPGGDQDFAGADARYTRAFRDYGVDLFTVPPDRGADLLRGLGRDVRVDLAAAIDDWGYLRFYLLRQKLPDTARLFQVTRLLDPDSVRNRVREIVAAGDGPALGRLAGELDPVAQPVQTVNLVAVYMYWLVGNGGDGPRAAGQFLQTAQPHHPGDFQINHNLAFFLNRERRYAEALPYSAAAIAVRPGSAVAWQDHAIALAGLNRNAEAIVAYRRIAALSPDAAFANRQLVDLLTRTGDREGANAARRELNQALLNSSRERVARNPKDATAHYFLGQALVAVGRFDEAVTSLREAVRLDGDHHGAAIGALAELLSSLRKLDEAIEVYRDTIRIAPGYAPAHFGLGNVLFAKRDYPGAADAYREAIRLDPKHAITHNQLGVALLRGRDATGAIAAFREAVRLRPNLPVAHRYLAHLLAAGPDGMRDGSKAVEYATRACELTDRKDPTALDALAAAYAEAGDFEKAVEYQKRALTLPNYEDPYGATQRRRLELYTHRKPYRDPDLVRREVAPPPREVKR